jgi:hypothetical protein
MSTENLTRREGIVAGIFTQLSGPDMCGPDWTEASCNRCGFRYPIAMTTSAYEEYVEPKRDRMKLPEGQTAQERLDRILWATREAITNSTCGDRARVSFWYLPNIPINSVRKPKVKQAELVCICGKDENGERVLTIVEPPTE